MEDCITYIIGQSGNYEGNIRCEGFIEAYFKLKHIDEKEQKLLLTLLERIPY